jgi:fatty acid desaturase
VKKQLLIEMHRPRWSGFFTWLLMAGTFFLAQALLLFAFTRGLPWLVVPLALVAAHVMHAHLIAFHEAAHGLLCPWRKLNDALGHLIGVFSFLAFGLYRAVHHYHHAYLATQRDEELWPFVVAGSPRPARVLAAVLELTCGLAYTPFLFLRAFLRKGTPLVEPAVRRRVWLELAGLVVIWGAALAVVGWLEAWPAFVVVYLVPAWVAGNLQSWRKYVEHVGLTGCTVAGSTRSIIPRSRIGRAVAASLFNEPYHGVHHVYARLPHSALPAFTEVLTDPGGEAPPPFPSYLGALPSLLRSLRDPRVGGQWLANPHPDWHAEGAGSKPESFPATCPRSS